MDIIKYFRTVLLLAVAGLFFVSSIYAEGLLGSVEFRSNSLEALPRWVNVLEKIEAEEREFSACYFDVSNCNSKDMLAWNEFMHSIIKSANLSEVEILDRVNVFANNWNYIVDIRNWGKSDYWASPSEFIHNSGDCEDYAIFKFVTLKRLGFNPDNLRIVVLHDSVRQTAHAVLAVMKVTKTSSLSDYKNNQEDILILDSLFNHVASHKEMINYFPYYSVNEKSRWTHIQGL